MKYLLVADGEYLEICTTLEKAKNAADDLVGDGYLGFKIYELNEPTLEGSVEKVVWLIKE